MNQLVKNITRQVLVNDEMDVVKTRLSAREVAREMGFNTVDQARISLAAGEIARIFARNMKRIGQIAISGISTKGQMGIQVVGSDLTADTSIPGTENKNNLYADLKNGSQGVKSAFALVDDYLVEEQDHEGVRITLMKWLS